MVIIMTIMCCMNTRVFALVQAVIALFTGFIIYMLFREKTFIHMVFCFPYESVFSNYTFWGSTLIRYYLPDFLWGYSLTAILYSIYPPNRKLFDIVPILLASFTGIFFEGMQTLEVFSGVGDMIDVLFYILATVVAYIIILNFGRRNKK